jgi:glutathione S-transferase
MVKAKTAAKAANRARGPAKAAVSPHTTQKGGAKPAAKAAPKKAVAKIKTVPIAAKPARAKQSPIDLYYWPTPNGWKVSIMLEECRLPYTVKPVNIGKGEQFTPEFLRISPNNRIPAIVDPDGPGGKPISVFESGAILQYLGRKTGKYYPESERARVEVDEWLFWQVGGLGPMAGQAHHFRSYAPEQIKYAVERYTNEVRRLYGIMNKRLEGREYLAGKYSIADMACWGWVVPYQMQGQNLTEFSNLKAWFERLGERPAVQKGRALKAELRQVSQDLRSNEEARRILFGQGAKE